MKKLFAILMVAVLSLGFSTHTFAQKKGGTKKPAKTTAVASKKSTKKSATTAKPKNGAFIVISKKDLNLRVYSRDSVLMAEYPVCLSKNKGNKQRKGDMKTPESPAGQPFKITAIQDASTWKHDFKDGRGSIKAYGHWFLRLLTPGHSGIGIHGSTNNESSVPGRASEGCIRLRDADIITLKENYAYVGMPVYIKAEGEGLYPWEK
ncbi:MAG: L,D-transpeptidase family protein [Muribaculaceae bacterium]|nr:L,D-transpeptidase family protein [Muribaculaceae bacterium]